ncbi:MAG: hypothetical protein CL908_20055 [Deltaproteobacteria bacterium]|nr:hypothetical protein [Deltaproteobacteria bacterium]
MSGPSDKLSLPFERSQRRGVDLGYIPLHGRFLHVMLDVVERCNLRCLHCAFVWWRDEKLTGARMSEELVERIGREVFPHTARLSLSCFHEPLIAPNRLLGVLEQARRANIGYIDMISNGLMFTERMAEKLLAGGLKRLYFSVDGATPETYARVRVGGDLETFKEKVALVVDTRRRLGLGPDDVTLSFIFVAMKSNLADAPLLVDLAADLGVDVVELRYLSKSDVAEISDDEVLWNVRDEADACFDAALRRAEARGIDLQGLPPRFHELESMKARYPEGRGDYAVNCGFPWNTIVLSPKGHLLPCCLWHGDDHLDSIENRPFNEVWNGYALRGLRRELCGGRLHTPACKDCLVQRPMWTQEFWDTYSFRQ